MRSWLRARAPALPESICFLAEVALRIEGKGITMKRFIAFAMISPAVLLFGQVADTPSDTDIRVISGRSVDLAPLHQWYRSPEGADRPLKHWARLSFLEIKPVYSGSYLQCLVDGEIGRREVLFKTLPQVFKDTVARMHTLQTNLNTVQLEIAAEEPEVRRREALYEGSVVRGARVEVESAFVTQRYEYERPSQRALRARPSHLSLT